MATTETSSEAATVPAGWYADPHDPTRTRYWNGQEWSDHVSADQISIERIDGTPAHAPAGSLPSRLVVMAATLGAVALLVAYGAWKGKPDPDPSPSFAQSDTAPGADPAPSDPDPSGSAVEEPQPGQGATDDPQPELVDDSGIGVAPPLPTIAVVYRVETNNGGVSEEMFAHDPPRFAQRDDGGFVLTEGDTVTNCGGTTCRRFTRPGYQPQGHRHYADGLYEPGELERRRILGREADCYHERNGGIVCWDIETYIVLLQDPGEEAMQPSQFTSYRLTATEIRQPTEADFALPDGAEIEEVG